MEAIIRTENKTLFEAILEFLKKLNFTVETRRELISEVKKSELLFTALRLKTKGIKFNREEANER